MRRSPLGIQKKEPMRPQVLHQGHQGDLAGVRFPVEHAFPEKSLPQGYSVQASLQPFLVPAFHTVGEAHLVKLAVCFFNLPVYPLFFRLLRPGAGMHHLRKSGIHPEFKRFFIQSPFEAVRDVEAVVQRNQGARVRFVKGDFSRFRVRHGKTPLAIGGEDKFRRQSVIHLIWSSSLPRAGEFSALRSGDAMGSPWILSSGTNSSPSLRRGVSVTWWM